MYVCKLRSGKTEILLILCVDLLTDVRFEYLVFVFQQNVGQNNLN